MPPRRRVFAVVIALLAALALISPADAAGGTWTRQVTVTPAAMEVWLQHVSCVSATDCEAVGFFGTSPNDRDVPLAERWNGVRWVRQAIAPIAGSEGVTWNGVSCVSASNCEAVGGVGRSTGGFIPLAERWNGSRWSRQVVPNVAGNAVWFDSVSCASASSCEAVGVQTSTVREGFGGPFAERWNGTRWVRQTVTAPAGGQQARLNAVSCVRGAGCEALGTYLDASFHMFLLAERWNGVRWVRQQAVNVTNAQSMGDVSCVSGRSCEAVGTYTNAIDHAMPLVEKWNGTRWVRKPTVEVSSTSYAGFSGVSCVSDTSCEAVGGSRGGPLAAHWNGSTWTRQTIPNLAASTELLSISCVSTTCEGVGDVFPRQGPRTVAERYRS